MSDATFDFTSRFLLAAADAVGVPRGVLFNRVRNVVLRLTQRIDPTVTLEVGAFEAGFSVWARENLPNARAMAFEANPYVHAHYKDEVTAKGVDYRNVAVSPTSGPVTIHVPRDFNGGERGRVNQMASLTTNLKTANHEAVEVAGVRLDDAVELAPDDRLVAWVDVEGALEQVLSGSHETLARAALVFVEVESEAMWEGQWLDSDVAAWFREIGLVPILRDFQRWQQYNVVFVSQELARDPEVAKLAAMVYTPVVKPAKAAVAAIPPPVPTSKLGRVQGLLQRTLQAQNDQLRAQNKRLRRQSRRLRRQLGGLQRRLALLDEETTV